MLKKTNIKITTTGSPGQFYNNLLVLLQKILKRRTKLKLWKFILLLLLLLQRFFLWWYNHLNDYNTFLNISGFLMEDLWYLRYWQLVVAVVVIVVAITSFKILIDRDSFVAGPSIALVVVIVEIFVVVTIAAAAVLQILFRSLPTSLHQEEGKSYVTTD